MSLSEKQCKAIQPKETPYKLFDGEGLYLEVMPSGSKLWRLKYRLHFKERRMSLGAFPEVSLAYARLEKERAKDLIRQGHDPVLVRIEQEQTKALVHSQTVELIAREWHGQNVGQWEERYAKTVLHRLEKYVFPDLGSYPANQVKPPVVLACLKKIEKTAPDMASRIRRLISLVFKYAIVTSRAETDPTYGLDTAMRKYRKGHFASIDLDDLPTFLVELNDYKLRLTRQTFLAIKLMLLTFVRTSELIGAKWGEIDFDKAMWTIPAERMKMNRPHLVPLSRQSVAILQELKEKNGRREYVFPSLPRPRKPMSKGTILVALKRMGYNRRMTGHGFRSLALGIMKEKLGYSHEVADRQLAHAPKSGVDRAYDRSKFLPQRKEMMQRYADYLEEVYIGELQAHTSVRD